MHEHVLIEEAPQPSFYQLLPTLRGLKVFCHTLFCLEREKIVRCVTNTIRTYVSFWYSLNCS